jgi:predicted RNA-binding Zn ribbon-like protein
VIARRFYGVMVREAGHTASAKPAPAPLDLVQRFVNTRNRMRVYDRLGSTEDAGRWLYEAGYGSKTPVGESELKRLRTIRESLRTILAARTGGSFEELQSGAARLDKLGTSVTLRPGFDSEGGPRLIAASEGMERLVEDLLAAAIWARHKGLWERLKACANEDCRWVFYDRSKNRSGNWCVMEICGSRAKMQAYRRRRGSHAG